MFSVADLDANGKVDVVCGFENKHTVLLNPGRSRQRRNKLILFKNTNSMRLISPCFGTNSGDAEHVIEKNTPWCNGLNEKSLPGMFVNGRSTDLGCYNRVTGIRNTMVMDNIKFLLICLLA